MKTYEQRRSEALYKHTVGGTLYEEEHFRSGFDAGYRDLMKELEPVKNEIENVHHALANLQEWYISDPDDNSILDRDAQVGNWCEKAFNHIDELQSILNRITHEHMQTEG